MWQAIEDDRLPCGHSRSEALHPDNEDAYEVRRLVCHACRAIHHDIDTLSEPKAAQFMYFVPQLETTES